MKPNYYQFKKAVPVWNSELRKEMNISLSFVSNIAISGNETSVRLAIAAADSYILRINGILVSYGPARSAKGFYRVDEIDILPYLVKGKNSVAIRVAAYNTNSFFVSQSLGFLCAEMEIDGSVVAATGDGGFFACRVNERIQKVNRYSFQRPFAELYDLADGAFDYELGKVFAEPIGLSETESKTFIYREAPYGEFPKIYPECVNARGIVSRREISEDEYYHCRFLDRINQQAKGYELSELEHTGYRDISELTFDQRVVCRHHYLSILGGCCIERAVG